MANLIDRTLFYAFEMALLGSLDYLDFIYINCAVSNKVDFGLLLVVS